MHIPELEELKTMSRDTFDDPSVVEAFLERMITRKDGFDGFIKQKIEKFCQVIPNKNIHIIFEKIHELIRKARGKYKKILLDRLRSYKIGLYLGQRLDIEEINAKILELINQETNEALRDIYNDYKACIGIYDQELYSKLLKYLSEFTTPSKRSLYRIGMDSHQGMRNNHINRDTLWDFFKTVNYICLSAISQNDITPVEIVRKCLENEHRLFSLIPILKLFIYFHPKFQETTKKLLHELIPAAVDNQEENFDKFIYMNRIALKNNIITKSDFFDIVSSLLFRNYLERKTLDRIINFIKIEFPDKEIELNHILLKSIAEIYGLQKLTMDVDGIIVGNRIDENSFGFETYQHRWTMFNSKEKGILDFIPFLEDKASDLAEFLIFNIVYAKSYWDWYMGIDPRWKRVKISKLFKELPNLVNLFFIYALRLTFEISSIKKTVKEEYAKLFIALIEKDYETVEKYGKELSARITIENKLLKRTISDTIQEANIFTQMELIKLIHDLNPDFIPSKKSGREFIKKMNERSENKYFTFRNEEFKITKSQLTDRFKKKYGSKYGRVLIFSNMGVNSIDELKGLDDCKELLSLYLGNNNITEIKGLEQFSELNTLDLKKNKIKRIFGLEHLKNLESLNLNRNQIEKIENLDSLELLEELDLSENKIRKIENLDKLKNLKKLNLFRNKISKIEKLDQLENLEKLVLTDLKIEKIENLDELINLKILVLQNLPLKRIEGLSQLVKLEHLAIDVYDNPGGLSEIEGLEHLISLNYVDIDAFNLNKKEVSSWVYVIILRFACMVKANNYESIPDWKDVFKRFPSAFNTFKWANSKLKKQWYIQQCSPNLLKAIDRILNDSEFESIRSDFLTDWKKIHSYAKKVFAHEFPRRNLGIVNKEDVIFCDYCKSDYYNDLDSDEYFKMKEYYHCHDCLAEMCPKCVNECDRCRKFYCNDCYKEHWRNC